MPGRCRETFRVRVRGDLACFTRPEFKVERVSYEVITPSAALGVLEAVHWKPAIRWVVTGIHVLAPVRFLAFRRNEVTKRVTSDVAQWVRGAPVPPFYADENRAQRNTLALRDVDYVIEAHFETSPRWGVEDTISKHVETFARRLERGQTFHQPYLGCREFAARVEPAPDPLPVSALDGNWRPRKLGRMLHDLEFGPRIVPRFYEAEIDAAGFIRVPPFVSATADETLTREGDR